RDVAGRGAFAAGGHRECRGAEQGERGEALHCCGFRMESDGTMSVRVCGSRATRCAFVAPVSFTQARKSPRSNLPFLLPSRSRYRLSEALSVAVAPVIWPVTRTVLSVGDRKPTLTLKGRAILSLSVSPLATVSPVH